MFTSNSEMHLRLARGAEDADFAMAEYMRAIEEAVRELKQAGSAAPSRRR
jgi:hypothetical protein